MRVFSYKIIVVGDPEVGKTSTILQFTDNAFRRTYIMTMGVNVSAKNVIIDDNKLVKFAIWDIAGQTKFQLTRRHYYDGAKGEMVVFDLTRPETFENVEKWHNDIREHLKKPIPSLILANKNDLKDQVKIDKKTVEKLANSLGVDFLFVSALSGENVDEAFKALARKLIEGNI